MKTCIDGYECPLAIESNHRIANHLAMLASYVSMQRLEFSRPAAMDGTEVLRLLDGIGAQLVAVSELHRMLTRADSLSSGDIGAHLARLCEALRLGPVRNSTIDYSRGAGCILPSSQILPVSQIVSEVVTNALKHGHRAGSAGAIRVRCLRSVADRIEITVVNDGAGEEAAETADITDGAVIKLPGIGFAMIAALVEQVKGTIDYRTSSAGFSVTLSLPAAVQAACGHPIFLRRPDFVLP